MALPVKKVILAGLNMVTKIADLVVVSHNAVKTLETEHERIHAGKAWIHNAKHYINVGSLNYFLMLIDSASTMHVRDFGFIANQGPMEMYFREDPFYDVNSLGVQLPTPAMNRTLINTPNFTLYGAPFIDTNSLGEELAYIYHPNSSDSPAGKGDGGGEAKPTPREWVVGAATQKAYLFDIHNLSVETATIQSRLWVYQND